MTSNITSFSQNIDTNFPVQGQDNPSQGFRDNFAQISLALDTAANEITDLQTNGNILFNLPNYTISLLNNIKPKSGTLLFVTDAPGGSQPCYFDGAHWYTLNRTQIV